VDSAHLPSDLDEFVFRFKRRRSRSRGMLFYRVLELAVAHGPVCYKTFYEPESKRCSSKTAEATRTSAQLGATFAEPPVEKNR
jgi:type II secretory pathway component PulM